MTDLLVVRKGEIDTAVNAAIAAQKGAVSGLAPLGTDSKVPPVNSLVESVAGRQGAITLAVADVAGALSSTDPSVTNTRTPTDGSVTNASVAASAAIAKTKLAALDITNADVAATAAIAETKLALASDAVAATPSRRTLGTGATQALPGNHSSTTDTRTPTDGAVTPAKMSADNKGVIICSSTTRPASPVEGQLIYETDTDQVLKNTGTPAAPVWANTATASAAATEAAAGVVELATAAEAQTGTDAVRAVHPAGLKSTMDARRGTTRVTAYTVNNVSIAANATLTTVDLRGLGTPPIPADAKGVEIVILGNGVGFYIAVDSADVTPGEYSHRLYIPVNGMTIPMAVPLGTGVNAGKISLRPSGAVTNVYMWPVGWWR